MDLDAEQRRAVVAICCAVARADGEVSPPEVETLFDILARFADGKVAFSEMQKWLDEGPPSIETTLPEGAIRGAISEALSVARADGRVDDAELQTIKRLFEHYAASTRT
jgi:tellurite resistance protein